MSEFQDGSSPDADHRSAALAAAGYSRTAVFADAEQRVNGHCSQGMLAVTAERLATDADRAEASGYLATIPADSAERWLD